MRPELVFGKIGNYFKSSQSRLFIIVDNFIYENYNLPIEAFNCYIIKSKEDNKNLETVSKIISKLLELQIGSNDKIVGIGGGVVTDVTAFVASIYKRGIKFELIPTTLIAQVDAAHGGKTGVNFGNIKNAVGTFAFPERIIIDNNFLKTLPVDDIKSGIVEMLKVGIINNHEIFESIEKTNLDRLTNQLIAKSINSKWEVIGEDIEDKKSRMLLNLGHTIGHSIETTYNMKHGLAVANGILLEMEFLSETFSENRRIINKIIQKFLQLNIPILHNLQGEKLCNPILNDKKRIGDSIALAFPIAIGECKLEKIQIKELVKWLKSKD